MSMVNVRTVVERPVRTPHRYGLFSVLSFDPDDRAGGGLLWDSLGCLAAGVAQDLCLTGTDDSAMAATVDCGSVGGGDPFTVFSLDDSSMGRSRDGGDEAALAREHLLLHEQVAVESHLTGILDTAATVVTVATADARVQLGEVEAQLAARGGEGIILVRRSLIAQIPDAFTTTGSTLRTTLGTPVAACGGWTPAAAAQILGVNALVAERSGISTGVGYALAINDRSAYAERDYSIGWECDPVKAIPA